VAIGPRFVATTSDRAPREARFSLLFSYLPAVQRAVGQVVVLVAVEPVVASDKVVGSQQKAARAAGRIRYPLARSGAHHVHDGLDQRARGEVLPRSGFDVLGVLLQQPLVNVGLDVHPQPDPGFALDEGDQAPQLGRVLDLVLIDTMDK
jgi:hypothetical protein